MIPPEVFEKLERLAASDIELLPAAELSTHFVLTRAPWAALVVRSGKGFGQIGAAGRLTEQGLAMLVWRGDQPFFQIKDWSHPATERDIADLRAFSRELAAALAE